MNVSQEPHPGDDLNGADVARKLAILARSIPSLQSSLPEGYVSVSTRSLVPDALSSVSSGSEFVDRLPEFDTEFEKLRDSARAEGSVLRFVGVIDVENGVVKADLEKSVCPLNLLSYALTPLNQVSDNTPFRNVPRRLG